MGYALNVALSIPMAIIVYMLTAKVIISMSAENKFNERVQKEFILGFIIGLCYIALGMTMLSQNSNMDNHSLRLAMYLSGGFLVLNSVFFSWDDLDEGTKILILGTSITALIIYTYRNREDRTIVEQ